MVKDNQPLIIAHRGGKFWKTRKQDFSYIEESIKNGADIVELDVRLKNNKYIVKHSTLAKNQGDLELALNLISKLKKTPIYLDIKDQRVDPNHLIEFVRKKIKNVLIIGSFYSSTLKKINKDKKVIVSYQVYSPKYNIETAKEIDADWIILWNYNIANWKIKELKDNGFKVAPAGNILSSQQRRYLKKGVNAVFVYDIKKSSKKLTNKKTKKSTFSYNKLKNIGFERKIARVQNTLKNFNLFEDKIRPQISPLSYPVAATNLSLFVAGVNKFKNYIKFW